MDPAIQPIEQKKSLGVSTYLNTEDVIAEMESEKNYIAPEKLNLFEKIEFLLFSLFYGLFLLNKRGRVISKYLRLDSPKIDLLTKKSLPLSGKSREEVGGYALSKEEMQIYRDRGLIGPFSSSTRFGQLDRIKQFCLKNPGMVYSHLQDPDIFNLSRDPHITEAVSSILGEKIDCVRSSIFVKEGNSQSAPTQWHMAMSSNFGSEDNPESNDYVSVWVALTDARRENGCLKLVPGSFRVYPSNLVEKIATKQLFFDSAFDAFFARKMLRSFHQKSLPKQKGSRFKRYLADRTNAASIVQRSLVYNNYLYHSLRKNCKGAVSLEAETSQFYIFTSENFHASLPNVSSDTRIAIAFRYARASLNMDKVKNMKTLIDMLPENIRQPLRQSDGYRLPAVRVLGQEILDSEKGNKTYLNAKQLFGCEEE